MSRRQARQGWSGVPFVRVDAPCAEQRKPRSRKRIAATLAALLVAACHSASTPSGLGDPRAGAVTIARQACGSCHSIPGITLADGDVGPPLDGVGSRMVIAGRLPNSADNMVRWLRDPQAIEPGNAMPDLGLSDREARNVAAYLYTLR